MIFRCDGCQTAIAIRIDEAAGRAEASCRHCDQRYDLELASVRGVGLHRLGIRARELTAEHGIDLPSANAVALGISELDRVLEIAAASGGSPATRSDGDKQIDYDPEFAPAVEAGRLTPGQAMERGQRAVYCERLRRRHRIGRAQAEAVADNRIPLLQALRERDASAERPVRVAAPRRTGRGVAHAVVAGLCLLVAIGVAGLWSRPDAEERIEAARTVTLDGGARYVADRSDRLLRVAGPDPGTVLRTFCRVGARRGRFEPAGMMPVETPHGRARLGLFRDPSQPDALLSVTIHEDRDAGEWVLDNGGRPLSPEPAPDAAWRRIDKRNEGNSGFRPATPDPGPE